MTRRVRAQARDDVRATEKSGRPRCSLARTSTVTLQISRHKAMGGAEGDEASVAGKTCVVTGANSGIGLEVARALARGGARVVLACRSRSKAANAAKDIISSTGNVNVECRALDLANLASVREFAEGFNGPEEVVDILVNNAGAMFKDHGVTDEGRERTWQTNALAPHYLARLMMPALARAAAAQGNTPGSARYVYVTSKLETKGVVAGELRSGTPEARMFNAIADKTSSTPSSDTQPPNRRGPRSRSSSAGASSRHPGERGSRCTACPRGWSTQTSDGSRAPRSCWRRRFDGRSLRRALKERSRCYSRCDRSCRRLLTVWVGTSAPSLVSSTGRWCRWRRARARGTRASGRDCGEYARLSTGPSTGTCAVDTTDSLLHIHRLARD